MRTLDALLRPLASLPPGLPLVADAPSDVVEALGALGLVVAAPEAAEPGSAAWGVAFAEASEVATVAARMRVLLAPGAWLSLVVRGPASPTDLVGRLEDAGYALAHAPEATDDGDGVPRHHVIVRRVDAGMVG